MLGSGLNNPLHGLLKNVSNFINELGCFTIALDVPTGLFAESNVDNNLENVVAADITLTFQAPKLSFLLPNTGNCVGELIVLDIGLHERYIQEVQATHFFTTETDITDVFKLRSKFSHKGNNGHGVIVGGSLGKIGAPILSARSCLRSGAGLVSAQIPSCGITSFQSSVNEAMVEAAQGVNELKYVNYSDSKDYGIGPGLGTSEVTKKALLNFLEEANNPLVLDADALNMLSESKLWDLVPANSILTPHLGEFTRMTGAANDDFDRLEKAKSFANKHGAIVVLKGAYSTIVSPQQEVYFNSTGNSGMATAGSGDVLTGVITSFLAQGYRPLNAAILGVYFHGLAGDLAAEEKGISGLIATDIIESLPEAISSFE